MVATSGANNGGSGSHAGAVEDASSEEVFDSVRHAWRLPVRLATPR